MWPELARLFPEFESAVLTGRDADGYPFSVRCRPLPDRAAQALRVQVGPAVPIQPGPASLLCHRHDERLWNQKSFLLRGVLESDGDAWQFRPRQLVPGVGLGGPLTFVRFVREARRAAARYLATRGLVRPRIPWAEVDAVKRTAR